MSVSELLIPKKDAKRKIITVDISSYDPIKVSHFKFVVKETGDVLGYMAYGVISANNGKVFAPSLRKVDPTSSATTLFELPILNFSACTIDQIGLSSTGMDSVLERVKWIINPTTYTTEHNSGAFFLCAMLTMFMRQLPHPKFEYLHNIVARYEKSRRKAEHKQFRDTFTVYTEQGNETFLMRLLVKNGYSKDVFIKPEPSDSRATVRRGLYVPQFYVKVPLQDVPESVALDLPLHPRGMLHLHPHDVVQWLWHRTTLNGRLLCDRVWRNEIHDERMYEFTKAAFRIIEKEYWKRNQTAPKRDRERISKSGGGVVDIEDIMLPACLRYDRWVKNLERVHLMYSLNRGGVSEESALKLVQSLSGVSERETKGKFDAKYYYDKSYKLGGNCQEMFDNKKLRGNIPRCPYNGNTSEECKKMCLAELEMGHLHWVNPENLKEPYQFIKWSKYSRKTRKKK